MRVFQGTILGSRERRLATRATEAEFDLRRLAVALDLFGREVADVAQREVISASAKLEPKRERRMRNLLAAAYNLREDVAPIIKRLPT